MASLASIIQGASTTYGVPTSLIGAVIGRESSGQNGQVTTSTVNGQNYSGLMQLGSAEFNQYGPAGGNIMDPTDNVNAGTNYLATLYNKYGSWGQALSAYNSGYPNSTSPAVQSYVSSVLNNAGMTSTAPAGSSLGTVSTSAPAASSSLSAAEAGSAAIGAATNNAAGLTTGDAGTPVGSRSGIFYILAILLVIVMLGTGVYFLVKG